MVEGAHAEAQHETRLCEVDVLHLDGGRNNGHVSGFHLFGWKFLWKKQEKSIETLEKKRRAWPYRHVGRNRFERLDGGNKLGLVDRSPLELLSIYQ